ncbi:MAG: glycosyltransferase family 2 protein [Phycisphaeraceae bacterium]
MSLPRISIITPSLNQALTIERTICSVLDQGYDNLEYLVIDGGSHDGSIDTIGMYEDQLAGWVCEPDTGPAEAINKGIHSASGDIIGILGADDLYLPGTLHRVAEWMGGPSATPWIVGKAIRVDNLERMTGTVDPVEPTSLLRFLMHDQVTMPTSAMFFHRRLLEEHGEFAEAMRWAYGYEYCCRLLARGCQPHMACQTLSVCRQPQAPRTAAQTVRQGIEMIAAAKRHADRLPLADRYKLWKNCDRRERIYALAEAELFGMESQKFLWRQVARHPWWLATGNMREALLRRTSRAASSDSRTAPTRRAA